MQKKMARQKQETTQKKQMSQKSKTTQKREWIEILPYGIVGGVISGASTMLFKKKSGKERFVVWFSELQSRIAIDQKINKEKVFDFVSKILSKNKSLPKYCFFVSTHQGRDVVKLSFGNSLKPLTFYADEVICFCMMNHCKFFCTQDFFTHIKTEIPKRFQKKTLVNDKPAYFH